MLFGLINVINRLPNVSHLFQLKAKHNELSCTHGAGLPMSRNMKKKTMSFGAMPKED